MNIINNKKTKDQEDAEDENEMLEEMERRKEIEQSEMGDIANEIIANAEKTVIIEPIPGIYDDDFNDPEILEEKALGADDPDENDKEYEKLDLESESDDKPEQEEPTQKEIELYKQEASKLFFSGEYEKSLEALNTLLDFNPDDLDLLFLKGSALSKLGKNQEALIIIDELRKVLDLKKYGNEK